MFKKSLNVFACLFSLAILTLPIQAHAANKKVVLRLAHEMSENHPYHAGAGKFGEFLSKKTNGEVTIQIYPNGTLGKQAQLVEAMSLGTVDLALTNTPVMERYVPELAVLGLPYVARSWEHIYKVVDGEIGAEFNKKFEAQGITVLAYHETGSYNISSTMPIIKPEDIRGIKTRVPQGASSAELGKALGCNVTTLAFSEVYTALQLGTINAHFTAGMDNTYYSKFYEVCKYYIFLDIAYYLEPLSMSKMVYDRLSPEHQKAIKEAAMESAIWQRNFVRSETKTKEELMAKNYGLIVHHASDAEKAVWAKATEDVYEKFPDWLPMVQRIKAVK